MNADPATQLRLLDLQTADTALDQLAHRRMKLPELAGLIDAAERRERVRGEEVEAELAQGEAVVEQRKLENEVDLVRQRTDRDRQRLASGGLPAKELEGLQHEVATLIRRQANLEDELLEVMERHEQVDTQLAELTAVRSAVDSEIADLTTSRDIALADIESAGASRAAARSGIAADLPADLLTLYERAREHGAGVGAAMLRNRRCEGCHLELSGAELGKVREAAADAVVRCEECGRILVRTAESGL